MPALLPSGGIMGAPPGVFVRHGSSPLGNGLPPFRNVVRYSMPCCRRTLFGIPLDTSLYRSKPCK